MMNTRIIYSVEDKVFVVTPAIEDINHILKHDIPANATDIQIVNSEKIPTAHFSDAWFITDGAVEIDMDKAREIHMDSLRIIRNKKLAELDIEYIKADESDDQAKKIQVAAKKKALRDMTKTFDLSIAKTPEDLKKLFPDILN